MCDDVVALELALLSPEYKPIKYPTSTTVPQNGSAISEVGYKSKS